jgi:hypothetical protein
MYILQQFEVHYINLSLTILTRPSDSCYQFEVFGKLTSACLFQIALETILLPILVLVLCFRAL